MGHSAKGNIQDMIPKVRHFEGIELILCPKQPGHLWISKYACALRYQKALKMADTMPDDEFGITLKVGFDLCKNCQIGRRYSQHLLKAHKAQSTLGLGDRTHRPRFAHCKSSGTSPGPRRHQNDWPIQGPGTIPVSRKLGVSEDGKVTR